MNMVAPNNTMDWDKLKVFHAAAEAGSFTHAGERLGLSQSAVSRQVSALESELSVSLFHRHARGLILTEQGELLYRTAHEVFMKLEAARTKLTDSRERPNGELKVQTTPGIGVHWLTPRLGEFLDLYPDIHITLITENSLRWIRSGCVGCRSRMATSASRIARSSSSSASSTGSIAPSPRCTSSTATRTGSSGCTPPTATRACWRSCARRATAPTSRWPCST